MSSQQETVERKTLSIACSGCASDLKYAPGTTSLKCEYCGAETAIEQDPEATVEEQDYLAHLQADGAAAERQVLHTVTCDSCGASSTLEPKIQSAECPYCATALVVEQAEDVTVIAPKSLLPFKTEPKEARTLFKQWLKGLWFAPGRLKSLASISSGIKGIYMPYWTYDADTHSDYSGERGEYYYETEYYTATENGEEVTRKREVRRTWWYRASGHVNVDFDDVLICASDSVPNKVVARLEPWDLGELTPFDKRYLLGFITERYQVGLENGFERAKHKMASRIRGEVKRDIGGDEQRIHSLDTSYSDISFKHILLPAYISAYRYGDKVYRFMVNARTGEVQGERPWSVIKIATAVLLALGVIIGGAYLWTTYQGG